MSQRCRQKGDVEELAIGHRITKEAVFLKEKLLEIRDKDRSIWRRWEGRTLINQGLCPVF